MAWHALETAKGVVSSDALPSPHGGAVRTNGAMVYEEALFFASYLPRSFSLSPRSSLVQASESLRRCLVVASMMPRT
ncbi:hypothetical protein GFJ39_05850 [Gluconobacter sp. AC10]|uniref:Uncharacterized protein n=1 Tax=Gluconobacter aidae TaxID=2662454 RepID=A0A7X1SPE5_9PROT|nr:hypothetical protein [Gluconobacter aidae]